MKGTAPSRRNSVSAASSCSRAPSASPDSASMHPHSCRVSASVNGSGMARHSSMALSNTSCASAERPCLASAQPSVGSVHASASVKPFSRQVSTTCRAAVSPFDTSSSSIQARATRSPSARRKKRSPLGLSSSGFALETTVPAALATGSTRLACSTPGFQPSHPQW